MRLLQQIRKNMGLCVDCGKPRSPTSSWCCAEHLKYRAELRRKFVNKAKEAGLCVKCGKPRPPEMKTRCQNCLNKENAQIYELHNGRIESGLCRQCGKPRDTGDATYCGVHAEEKRVQSNKRHHKRQAEKLATTPCALCNELNCAPYLHAQKNKCAKPNCTGKRYAGRALCRFHERELFILQGLCSRCHVRPLSPRSKSRCEECLKYAAEKQREYAAKELLSQTT